MTGGPTEAQATGAPASVPEVYATFVGTIDQAAAYRLTHWLAAMSQKPTSVHLLFQSAGGSVADGVYLYELFRTLPFPLTIYNSGSVSSVAAVAFLGANHRKVGTNATFMLHRTTFSAIVPANAKDLRSRVETLAIDDQRTERILREHLRLEPSRWNDLDGNDVWFAAEEAVAVGFVDEIAGFAPPTGTMLWDFNLAVQGTTP